MNDKKEMIRFMIAGTFIGSVDFALYFLLMHFVTFSVAKAISFTCAGIIGYLLNKYWTLKQDQPSSGEIGRYAIINLIALGLNVVTNHSILNLWPGAFLLALAIASLLTGLFTYVFFKLWVFRTPLIGYRH